MSQGTIRPSALIIAGVYLFLFTLFVWPLVDLAATGWPFRPGSLEWRYGFLGLMTSYWHTPLLATVLSMGLALFLHHGNTLRALSVLCLCWCLGLVLVMGLFPLDAIQLRSATPEENRAFLETSAIISELKHFTAFLSLLLLGWGGWKTAGKIPKKSRGAGASELTAEVLRAQKKS